MLFLLDNIKNKQEPLQFMFALKEIFILIGTFHYDKNFPE